MPFVKRRKLKEQEEELNKTREDLDDLIFYLEQITSFLPVAVCIITGVKVFLDVNDSFEKLTGYPSLEIIGKPIDSIFEEKENIKTLINSVEKKGDVESEELTLLTSKKKKIPVRVSCGQRKDNQQNITGYFLTIVDISESKEFQKKLEETVRERTKQLRRRLNELEIFHNMTVGRELKMIELKKEIKGLKEELKGSKKNKK
jgi:PAS domain S-box-containing protein